MQANADCTLYRRIYDSAMRKYCWQASVIQGVHWQGRMGAATDKGGMTAEHETLIFIPLQAVAMVAPEDKIIKGTVGGAEEALTITGVEVFDYGRPDMRHWEVTAK